MAVIVTSNGSESRPIEAQNQEPIEAKKKSTKK